MKHIKSFNQLNEVLDVSTRKSAYDKMSALARDMDNLESKIRQIQANNMINNLSGPSEELIKKLKEYFSDRFKVRAEIDSRNVSLGGLVGGLDTFFVLLRIKLIEEDPTSGSVLRGGEPASKYMPNFFNVKITKAKYTVTDLPEDIKDSLLSDRGFINKLRILVKSIQENDIYTPNEGE